MSLRFRSLKQVVDNYSSFSERYHVLLFPLDDMNRFDEWAIESLVQLLEESPKTNEDDGIAVAEMLQILSEDDPILQR